MIGLDDSYIFVNFTVKSYSFKPNSHEYGGPGLRMIFIKGVFLHSWQQVLPTCKYFKLIFIERFPWLGRECQFKPQILIKKGFVILREKLVSSFFFPHMESMKINYFLDWFCLFQEDSSQLKTYTEVMALSVSPYLSGILRFRFSSLPGLHSSVLFPSQLCFPAKVLCIQGSPNL